MTIMFYTCFYRYLAEGPLFPKDIGDADSCRVNWWVDLLMVHNLVRTKHMASFKSNEVASLRSLLSLFFLHS